VYSERSDRWMKERRKVSDVLGIKNRREDWAQLTFTKRAFGWTAPEQRLECKIRFLMRYGLAWS
jgi:hypothetical protein